MAVTIKTFQVGKFTFEIVSGGPRPAPTQRAIQPKRTLLSKRHRLEPGNPFWLEPPPEDHPGGSLRAALRHTAARRWRGMRSERSCVCLTEKAIETLERLTEPFVTVAAINASTARARVSVRSDKPLASLLVQAVDLWLGEGIAPATIVRRLNCLSCLGVDVNGSRPRMPRRLKWWLKPEEEAKVCTWLRSGAPSKPRVALVLADLIEWTTLTGLRLEESLRLRWSDVMFRSETRTAVTVPGTKTTGAQATLPISTAAAAILRRIRDAGAECPFPLPQEKLAGRYNACLRMWVEARVACALGIGGDPRTAQMKAFRRSAARALHMGSATKKAMPLDAVRQYLRHENVRTTMGYLHLTGGIGEAEMAQWLD